MRRENRGQNKDKISDNIITYTIIGVSALIIAVIAIIIYSATTTNSNKNSELSSDKIGSVNNTKEDSETASTKIGKSVNESKNEANTNTENIAINLSNLTNTNDTVDTNSKTEKKEENNSTSEKENTVKTEEVKLNFSKPVDGEVIKEFSNEQLIYSETLEEWTTHTGVDIKAEESATVVASEAGTVKSVKNDPRYGITITIDHGNGYQIVYSNLLNDESVVEGEKVEKGQVIGNVGKTAVCEKNEESHLHFEILKDYKQVNPNEYIK